MHCVQVSEDFCPQPSCECAVPQHCLFRSALPNGRLAKHAREFFGSMTDAIYVTLNQKISLTSEATCAHQFWRIASETVPRQFFSESYILFKMSNKDLFANLTINVSKIVLWKFSTFCVREENIALSIYFLRKSLKMMGVRGSIRWTCLLVNKIYFRISSTFLVPSYTDVENQWVCWKISLLFHFLCSD